MCLLHFRVVLIQNKYVRKLAPNFLSGNMMCVCVSVRVSVFLSLSAVTYQENAKSMKMWQQTFLYDEATFCGLVKRSLLRYH